MRVSELLNRLKRGSRRSRFEPPARHLVFVPETILAATAQLLASYGALDEPHEGIVYWAGLPAQAGLVVISALAPQARTTSGSYTTSAVANAFVIAKINELHLHLVAQVHGHPSSWVGHSDGDVDGAFMPYDGFYSVVAPFYGRRGLLPLTKCGIHRFNGGCFRQLTADEIADTFIVVPASIDMRRKPV